MATTTPNFGWPVPTSTDLVKDGATAIEALGDGIDASLLDLKGGTTGQVLAKASNTDLDYSWVTTDDANAIQNAIVDAKGDLISATANDTPARLAVGNNGETLVADSSTSTGLRYQGNFSGGKNLAYNSNFDIWQRGTSFTATGYSADRWYTFVGGTATVSQETSIVPTGSTYSTKILTGAASSYAQLYQAFEAQDVNDWCGQTITFSALVRSLASFSGSVNIVIATNTTANTMTGGTWTTQATSTITPSTSVFTKTSVSYLVPAGTKGIRIELNFTSAQASGTGLYWGQTQLEIGSVATAYSRGNATIAGELTACQRYYYRQTAGSAYAWMAYGGCQNTTNGQCGLVLPVQMRVVPTGTLEYANLRVTDSSYAGTLTTLALNTGESSPNVADIYVTATGLTGGRPLYIGANNNTGAYLAVTAEL